MYKHILFATDFSDESNVAEARAVEAANQHGAKLSIIHVVEYYPSVQLEGGIGMPDIGSKLDEDAERELEAIEKGLSIELAHTHIGHGSTKHVIAEYAKEIGADLIVLGSHGRHGIGLLLGSTANGVLHVAECDVLAVRIKS